MLNKVCLGCLRDLPLDMYNLHAIGKEGRRSRCKDCRRGERRRKDILRKFGLSEATYESMLDEQDGLCMICQLPQSMTRLGKRLELSVDHDHATGRVRGLLCNNCNSMLGMAKDDPTLLRRGATYLEHYRD